MKLSILFIASFLLPLALNAQLLADFESESGSPSLSTQTGSEVGIRNNPSQSGNASSKVAYYKKASGNWRAIALTFESPKNTSQNDRLNFKVRSSTQGRVFVKIIRGNTTILESWAPDYGTQPQANTWTDCFVNIASIKNQEFDRIEVNASVDNQAEADVYLDDFRLANSLSPNGEPIIELEASAYQINQGESIVFSLAESTDSDGTIDQYFWNFGDGTTSEQMENEHIFIADGVFMVQAKVTDNEGKSTQKKISINVLPNSGKIGTVRFISSSIKTFEKVEAVFLINENYANVFDPAIVQVDAEIIQPNQQVLSVPCFYFQKAEYTPDQWATTEEKGHWRLRFSASQIGQHQIKIKLKDASGTITSESYTITVAQGAAKGYIQMDETSRQHYVHSTGESFTPLGINAAWYTTSNYAKIFENLSEGGANLVRYWQVPFDRQGLEWRNGSGFYKGLGVYSQEAAAEQDSIFALCEGYGILLQPVLFQHGMFSENVNSNWSDNPYNKANGGPLNRAEEYFYNEEAKVYTKKLLRYIVARWGYSRHIFAWELFNEVNFTGLHPSQSALWRPGVISWHDEMGQHIKSLDVFNHLITTSSDESQIIEMDGLEGLDNVQYHLYNTNLLDVQIQKDLELRNELTRTGLINGEYGLDVNTADVPFDDQRISIWTGIFTQVPHLMWKWENYLSAEWANLFKGPSDFVNQPDFKSADLAIWNISAGVAESPLRALGLKGEEVFYALIFDTQHRENLSNATVNLSGMPAGNYIITYTDILTGEQQEETKDIQDRKNFPLPTFSKGIAIRAQLNYAFTLGLENDIQRGSLALYPNPTSGVLYIDQKISAEIHQLIITNALGHIQTEELKIASPSSLLSIDLRKLNLATGIYHIQLKSASESYSGRIFYEKH